MNLATTSVQRPQRPNGDCVSRTQEFGEIDSRHTVRRIRLPKRRPPAYQSRSATRQATTATMKTTAKLCLPCVLHAPMMTNTGYEGTGKPSCAARTLTKTTIGP